MDDRYYVYLLRDPREPDFLRSIFYVGKGTGNRPMSHQIDALSRLGLDGEDVDDARTIRLKDERLREIHAAGMTETVDVLVSRDHGTVGAARALAAEAALIELLAAGSVELTNQVRGHDLRLTPGDTFRVGSDALEVSLPSNTLAVVVPVNGIWGGRDYSGAFVQASPDDVWENARRTWSPFAAWRCRTIASRAGTDEPVLLVALAQDPRGQRANIVVGAFPLTAAVESTDPEDRKGGYTRPDGSYVDEYPGWVLERAETEYPLAASLLHGVLVVGGTELRRPQDRSYVGDWS